jgi:hypothetical protein
VCDESTEEQTLDAAAWVSPSTVSIDEYGELSSAFSARMILQMLKIFKYIVVLCSLSCSLAFAATSQYVGAYSAKNQGGDAMSGTHLLIMADGNYAVIFFGGALQGTWKVLPDGGIELREWKGDSSSFLLYGRTAPGSASQVRIEFEEFQESSIKVGLTPAKDGHLRMHPAFNEDSNCYEPEYSITRPVRDLPALLLVAFPDQRADPRGQAPSDPATSPLYSFDLSAAPYNDYHVVYNKAAAHSPTVMTGHLVNGQLTLSGENGQGIGDSTFGERREISSTDLKELPEMIADLRKPTPDRVEFATGQGDSAATSVYTRVPGTSIAFDPQRVVTEEPLFTARCKK